MQESIKHQTIDDVTVVMVGFNNFKIKLNHIKKKTTNPKISDQQKGYQAPITRPSAFSEAKNSEINDRNKKMKYWIMT